MKIVVLRFLLTSIASVLFCGSSLGQAAEAVLHSFGAYPTDGTYPEGGLLFDAAGNIYGITNAGGENCLDNFGCGTAYELSPMPSGGWTETILYNFCSTGNPSSCPDGAYPSAGLIMDAKGNLYGTASGGGTGGEGTIFRLSPPSVQGGSWTQTVLWSFSENPENGAGPGYGKLNMDSAGNIYGTTAGGGSKRLGTVFELSPQSDGTYSFSILHSFSGSDGYGPLYGVTFDSAGNLYGTTAQGGEGKSICYFGCGLIYKLSESDGTWTETILFEFDGIIGAYPISPISIDKFGNLYGTVEEGGSADCLLPTCGGVFKLVLGTNQKNVFYFAGGSNDGNPQNGVVVGEANALYGTAGLSSGGEVYRLQDSHETILYNFCSLPNCADGAMPSAGNIVLREGALYGATVVGGTNGLGVVYSVTK